MKRTMRAGLFVSLLVLLSALAVFANGSKESPSSTTTAATTQTVAPGQYKEAPMLSRLVAQGKLPPVDQRLPDKPFVVGPGVLNGTKWLDWTAGHYSDGRVLETVALDSKVSIMDIDATNFLWAPEQSTQNLVPVLLSDFSTSSDYKVFNFTIRKGLRWSNGDPVTTDDVKFTFDDLYNYPAAGIPYPPQLHSLGDPRLPVATLNITGPYTFSLTFDRPYGYFVADLRSWITDTNMIMRPSSFLKQYHPKYTSMDKLNAMAKDAGVPNWQALLQAKADSHWARSRSPLQIGVPTLQPWIPVQISDTVVKVERNPYFCEVDTNGQQLPYIDSIESTIIKNKDAILVKILSGGVDYVIDDFVKLTDMPIYLNGAQKAGYHVELAGSFNGPPVLGINQDYDYQNPNSQWQVLIQDPQHRFGKAISLAINHEDVNKTLYFDKYGMSDLVTGSTYDPAQANQLLDSLGMTKRDSNGFRTYPDGSQLAITIVSNGLSPDQISLATLISKYLQAVGINATAKTIDNNIYTQKAANNEYQMTVMWTDEGAGWQSGISWDYWPDQKAVWAPESAIYNNTLGKSGRKPPQNIQDFFNIAASRETYPPGSSDGTAAYGKLMNWFSQNYVMIWAVGQVVQPMIISNNLRNIPQGTSSENYPVTFGATEAAQQWYFAN